MIVRLLTLAVCSLAIIATAGGASGRILACETETHEPLSSIVKQLDSGDPDNRAAAIRKLAALGPDAAPALPRLAELLGDQEQAKTEYGSMQIRYHVIEAFKRMGPIVDEPLLGGLESTNRQVRIGVVAALGELRQARFVNTLVGLLKDRDREVASYASTALKQIGEAAIKPLIAALASDNAQTRSYTAATLGNIRDVRVVKPIARLLYDSDENVREFAVEALRSLAHSNPLGTVWRHPDEVQEDEAAIRAKAAQDARLKDLVTAELWDALRSGDEAVLLAVTRSFNLAATPGLIGPLAACLASNNCVLRRQVIDVLAHVKHGDALNHVVAGLQDKDADVRATAAFSLLYQRNRPDLEPHVRKIVASLDDSDPRVRGPIVQVLGNIATSDKGALVPKLIRLAQEDEVDIANSAMKSLATIGDQRAVEPLVALLANPSRRLGAAVALAQFGDVRALGPLRALLSEKNIKAIAAIGVLKDCESVEQLIRLLDDNEESIRRAASEALGSIRDPRAVEPLIRKLDDRKVIHSVARALGDIQDPRAIKPLIAAGKRQDSPFDRFPHVHENPSNDPAAWPLFHMGASSIEPLGQALHDESVRARRLAAWVLYNLASQGGVNAQEMKPAVDGLVKALDDASPVVRNHAAMALGVLEDARAVDALIDVATASDEPSYVYQNAAAHLSRIRDARSVEPLIQLLGHDQPEVRTTAARALGRMGDPRAVAPLLRSLNDDNPGTRAAAARGLGILRARSAIEPLTRLLADDDAPVRASAADGLGRMGDAGVADTLAALKNDAEVRVRVAGAIALLRLDDPRGVQQITICLNDENRENREHAAAKASTSFLKTMALVDPLILAINDSSIRVRLYAADALGRIGSPAAVDALLGKLSDKENLQHVLEGLVASKDERAFVPLTQHLHDHREEIRQIAAYGLGEFGRTEGVAPLIAQVDDASPVVRVAVLKALTKLNPELAMVAIRDALHDQDPIVRSYAKQAVKKDVE